MNEIPRVKKPNGKKPESHHFRLVPHGFIFLITAGIFLFAAVHPAFRGKVWQPMGVTKTFEMKLVGGTGTGLPRMMGNNIAYAPEWTEGTSSEEGVRVLRVERREIEKTFGAPILKFTAGAYMGRELSPEQADTICGTEYPGYEFCTASRIYHLGGELPDPITYASPFIGGWVNVDDVASTSLGPNCWGKEDETAKGTRLYVPGSTASRWWTLEEGTATCSRSYPICCVRK